MSDKNTTNDDNYQHYPVVIGDILLHSEIKSTPIQVIIQSLIKTSFETSEKPTIPRLLTNSTETTNNQTRILCDLKNSTIVKLTHERTLSTKRLMCIHKAGWALVKEMKSKVITMNNIESKISTVNTNSNNEQIHF